MPAKIDIHPFYKGKPRHTRNVLAVSYGTLNWKSPYGDVYMFPIFYYWMKLYGDVKTQFKKKTWITTLLRSDLWGPDFSGGITPTVDSVLNVLGTSSMKSTGTVRLAQPLLPAVQTLLDDFRQTAVEYLSSVPITATGLRAPVKRGRDDDAGSFAFSVSKEKAAPSSSDQARNAAKTMLMISGGKSDDTTSV